MIDPMQVRQYLSTLGQGAGSAGQGQAGGIQGLLANLRQQVYGSQAAGRLGPNGVGGGAPGAPTDFANAVTQTAGVMKPGGDQIGTKPAWQLLAERGITGQGSAAANKAAAAELPPGGEASYGTYGGGQTPEQLGMLRGAVSAGLLGPGAGGMLDAGNLGVPKPGQAGGIPPSDMQQTALTPMTGGGLEAPLQVPGSLPPPPVPMAKPGGALPGTPLPAPAPAPPPAPPPAPAGAGAAGGAAPPPSVAKPPAGSATGPGPTATFGTGRPVASPAAAPAPAAAALGAAGFKGPNAARIRTARAGLYNNVRQALARPRAGGRR